MGILKFLYLGLLLYDNGRSYEGEFYNDLKHGYGIEVFV